jgi:hypothetical protein
MSAFFRLFVLFFTCATLTLNAASPQTGTLVVKIVAAANPTKMLPARAWVSAGGKQLFQPETAATPYDRDRSFSCDGAFAFRLTARQALVHVEKGKEWLPVNREVRIDLGRTNRITISLRRWIDLPAEGWFSSDLHVHFGHDKPDVLRQLSLADDVHVVPAFSVWLRGRETAWPEAWPKWPGGSVVKIDATHLITRNNLEIERIGRSSGPGGSVGATFLYNLERPVYTDRFDTRFPTDATLALTARALSKRAVVDTDKPSWAETVVGAALGVYDTAQLCHNHFHRANTLAGGWGMIGPLAPDERSLTEPDELFHRTNRQYYRWLNCGIRMGVSGGSAMGVMAVPLGYNRTYAKVSGRLSAEKYWAAVKAGRTVATSGPMLEMGIDGKGIGETIRIKSGGGLRLSTRVRLRSAQPVESVELVNNGKVIYSEALGGRKADPSFTSNVYLDVSPTRSGWYCARAYFRAPDGRLRQAHTSPVYLIVDGKPIASRSDAEYNIRWIDRLIQVANHPGRFASIDDRDQVLAIYSVAREYYGEIAELARQHWGD